MIDGRSDRLPRNIGSKSLPVADAIQDIGKSGGRDRDRTGDPLLAKQVLSQLSYTPTFGVTFILKHFRAL
jgi:hypothetical protein